MAGNPGTFPLGTSDRFAPVSGICLIALDTELRIRVANMEFLRHLQCTPAAIEGSRLADILAPQVRADLLTRLTEVAQGRCEWASGRIEASYTHSPVLTGEIAAVALHGEARQTGLAVVVIVYPDGKPARQDRFRAGHVLTEVEAHILEGIAAGHPTIKLAPALHLSRQGVEYHVTAMMRRFRVPNRTALISRAYALGILSNESWPPRVPADLVR